MEEISLTSRGLRHRVNLLKKLLYRVICADMYIEYEAEILDHTSSE